MATFIVNTAGATHSVADDLVEALLAQGFRLATAEEITAWYAMQGLAVPAEVSDATSEHGEPDQPRQAADRRYRRR